MPFNRPTLSTINDRVRADLRSRIEGSNPDLRRSVLGTLAAALAGVAHGLYGYLQAVAAQAVPYTATASDLERWASLWGISRRAPTRASGSIVISGNPGATLSTGTSLQAQDGTTYSLLAGVAIQPSGSVVGNVAADTAGLTGNQVPGANLSFVNPRVGVNAIAQVDSNGITGGTDLEDDDSLKARMLDRIQAPPHGGNAADYRRWALSVAGVTRAWVFPLYLGAGNVRVYIVNDNYVGSALAAPGTVAAAQAYLDSVRPVTADVDVVVPTRQPVNLQLTAGPDSPTLRSAIQAALADLFLREAAPEGTVLLSHIREAISQTAGEYDNVITSPTGNVTAGAGSILVLGTITWA